MHLVSPVLLLSLWVVRVLSCSDATDYPPDYGPKLCTPEMPEFDYIVAGAGSAGCVVASRLSEDPNSVLLLERGTDSFIPSVEIPLLFPNNFKTDIDYQYLSEPHTDLFQGLEGRQSPITKGKVSGGSSSINGAVYTRGYPRDYDRWKEMGCVGWDYASVLPYFLKSENFHGNFSNRAAMHGVGGPLSVTPFVSVDPAVKIFSNGFQELDQPQMSDVNGLTGIGYGYFDGTTRKGKRCSTFKAFLSNSTSKKNLFFARNTIVNKVVFSDRTAIGVEVTAQNGTTCIIRARKEVILSLGSIATPQVLLLSGIGPKDHLSKMGIPVIADLPVGLYYQDHQAFPALVFSDRKNRTPEQVKVESQALANQTFDLVQRNISTIGLSLLTSLLNTKHMDSSIHNIQFQIARITYKVISRSPSMTANKRNVLYNVFGVNDETAKLFAEYNDQTDTIFIVAILTDVISTGRIELKTLNAADHPKISLDFLSDEREVESLLAAVRFIERLNQTAAVQKAGLVLEHINYKACRGCPKSSDGYWRCAFKQLLSGYNHGTSSVRMGPAGDVKAVLDLRLRVQKVCNLRVADASVMPHLVSMNTNAGTIMIGEKAADMIKEDSKAPSACNFQTPPNVNNGGSYKYNTNYQFTSNV